MGQHEPCNVEGAAASLHSDRGLAQMAKIVHGVGDLSGIGYSRSIPVQETRKRPTFGMVHK